MCTIFTFTDNKNLSDHNVELYPTSASMPNVSMLSISMS